MTELNEKCKELDEKLDAETRKTVVKVAKDVFYLGLMYGLLIGITITVILLSVIVVVF